MSNPIIAAIGASAGGVQALREFFEHAPAHSGISYVVLLHLSPAHDSQLARVIQQVTALPVQQVLQKTRIEPDHIYILPPDKHLTMADGSIVPSPNTNMEERRAPVDIFFRSLAETLKSRAVGVILSGTGANGSMGLKRIKEEGGAVFVQNPHEAEFNEMPRNAIATGLVDDVLNVADIPAHVLSYRNTLEETLISDEPEIRVEEQQQALREIFTQLRLRTGHDFTNYKRATLLRRIGRRMAIRALTQLPEYAAFVTENPEETEALLKDLLISVTSFFRDKWPFEYLEAEILPQIFGGKGIEDQVRIWVAGCATGEEAYSIAMLCAERTLGVVDAPKVQIFATDIDEAAVATSRDGYYTLNDAADVSPARLARFFTREGEGYRIRREIRESILFAHHNFLKDPPFSRIDLVSCRNVLIYLNRPAQERVMETFHFALKPEGFLLLGTSESVDTAGGLFDTYNREQHIYQSRLSASPRPLVIPESIPGLRLMPHALPPSASSHSPHVPRIQYGELHMQLLEQYAPPSLVVNGDLDVVHTSPRAGNYLRLAAGEPTQAVLKLVRDELRSELRSCLYQAGQEGAPTNSVPVRVRTAEGIEHIRIHVRPVPWNAEEGRGFLLVVFEPAVSEEHVREVEPHPGDEDVTRHLEDEVSRLRAQVRASNEQHEFQAEELKAGNEELQAMNEELRSATEELETSKEELQSINEELSTVNQELKVKVEEATMVSNNLQNLINSTDIGTIFLDRSLRVVLFTPAARTVFNLIPADHGRPLSDITSKLDAYIVQEDAQAVLEQLLRIEREVHTVDGRTLLIRLSPYRTEEDRIQGVVISLVDITERKLADEAIRDSEEKFRTLFETIDEGFAILELERDGQGKITDLIYRQTNPSFERHTGWANVAGRRASELLPNLAQSLLDIIQQVAETGEPSRSETFLADLDRWYDVIYLRVGGPGNPYVAAVFKDITERKRTEERQWYLLKLSDALRSLADPLQIQATAANLLGEYLNANQAHYVETVGDFVYIHHSYGDGLPPMTGRFRHNDYGERLVEGLQAGKVQVCNDTSLDPAISQAERAVLASSHVGAYLAVPMVKGGEWVATLAVHSIAPRAWKQSEIDLVQETAERTWASVERARVEEALRVSEERYRVALHSADMAAWDWNIADGTIRWNDQHFLLLGLQPEQRTLSVDFFMGFVHPEDAPLVAESLQLAVAKTGLFRADAFRIIRADSGDVRWMTGYGRTVAWSDGKATRMVGVMYDITSRVEVTQTLRDKQLKLEIAQRAARVGIWGFDPTTGKGMATPEWNALTGYPEPGDTFDMDTFLSLVHPDDRQKVIAANNQAGDEQSTIELEFRLKHPQRGWLWLLKRGQHISSGEGNTMLMGSLIDITEQKLLEQQKDEFIGIASHELRTPVTSIKAYAEVLEEMFENSGDHESAVLMQRLDLQVDRLTALIYALLDTTRIVEGRLQMEKASVDIDELIADTADAMHSGNSKPKIELSLQAEVNITVDRERIRQVLVNLIGNALKYSPKADRIVIRSTVEGSSVSVCVQDFGIGISEQSQGHVFDRFFRDSDANIYSGLGLGLFISAGIVREHGGDISVQSKKGEGSTFCFRLPI